MASLALSWLSVLVKRARTELPSKLTCSACRPAALRASSTRATVALSTLVMVLRLETCTAGASPKKLGSV